MQIKTTTDNALRILVYLVLKNNVVNSKEIADSLEIPQKNVLSIGRLLKSSGYVNIISGPYGGYRIDKNAEDVLLYDVISAFESVKISSHSKDLKESKDVVDCAMENLYSELQSTLEEKLKSKTLAFLISGIADNPDEIITNTNNDIMMP